MDIEDKRRRDRERKRAARAAARAEKAAVSRAHAQGPSASASLASPDDVRSVLEWALAQVQSDVTNSPTSRARVAAQIAREASALLQVSDLTERLAAIEAYLEGERT